jgi:cytochrome P450
LTLSIVSAAIFDLDTVQTSMRIGDMISQWVGFATSPRMLLFPHDLPGTPYRQMIRHSEKLEAAILEIIAQKRASTNAQYDILTLLMHARDEAGVGMSDADLVGQVNLLFIAGHETSAVALMWLLFLLEQHPRVLADLLDELTAVLQGEAPTVEQLAQCQLLEHVVHEGMRLFPPAYLGRRISKEPFTLGPYQLPANARVYYSQYITHHMPETYPDPEHFLPQRWETINPSPYEFLPFGAGSRMCIGSSFALMEIKIILAMILQRYRLAIQDGTMIDRAVTTALTIKNGLPMTVFRQDRQFRQSLIRGNVHDMVDLA